MSDNQNPISYELYVDGSCKPLFRGSAVTFGGWSYYIVRDSKIIECQGGAEIKTTNQKMELYAAIQGLTAISKIRTIFDNVKVYSDSAYLINCYLQQWHKTWKRNKWLVKSKPVANQGLWEQIIPYFNNPKFTFHKVKGHSGNVYNELCDKMAQTYAETERINWRGDVDFTRKDLFEVDRGFYADFVKRINPEIRVVEERQMADGSVYTHIKSKIRNAYLCSRHTSSDGSFPEKYYVWELLTEEESQDIPLTQKVVLTEPQQVQRLFELINKENKNA